jgi:hypothetical protein
VITSLKIVKETESFIQVFLLQEEKQVDYHRIPNFEFGAFGVGTAYIYFSLECGCLNVPSDQTLTICPNVSEPSCTKMAFVLPSLLYLAKASPRQPTIQRSSLEQRRQEEGLPGVRRSSPAMSLTTSLTVFAWN